MSYAPIALSNVSFAVAGKPLITSFTATIPHGSKIGIIGRNGSGKSTLLRLIEGLLRPAAGSISLPTGATVAFVPQLVTDHDTLSGSQRFNAALSQALSSQPDILLLDEPTNHLDRHNRRSLLRMLQSFRGTLIVVSHDPELLRTSTSSLWHLEAGHVHISSKKYDEYLHEREEAHRKLIHTVDRLNREKKAAHTKLMEEQARRKKQKVYGEKKYASAPGLVSGRKKETAEVTNNKKSQAIESRKQLVLSELGALSRPEIILRTFTLKPADHTSASLVTITDGSIGYREGMPVLQSLNLHIAAGERIALIGANGSGKSTLIKGILCAPGIQTAGLWRLPSRDTIGYLDQNYATLDKTLSVLETIQQASPRGTPHTQLRQHLNRYLFRKNEEIDAAVATLSGGELARLSLAVIGANTPELLILDEVTNNLDLETKEHIIQVLQAYPGALLIISHDYEFLGAIDPTTVYEVADNTVRPRSSVLD